MSVLIFFNWSLEMSFTSTITMSRSLGQLRRFLGHLQAAALLATPLANDSLSRMDSQSAASSNGYDFRYSLNPAFTLIALLLTAAFVIVGFFALCVRKCGLVSADANSIAQRNEQSHSKGLDSETLAQFPVIKYQATAGDVEEGEKGLACAVCLAQFQQNENVLLLPQCNHSFHPECIHKWLASNRTCPLCRTSLAHSDKLPVSSQEIAAEHEIGEASAPAIGEPQGAASAQSFNIDSGLLERVVEREVLLIPSRSITFSGKAVQEMETK